MIIIHERFTPGGKKVFDLEEIQTGQKRTWTPPRNLDPALYRKTLCHVAQNFESQILNASGSPNLPNTLAPSSIINADTPFGVYATQVFMPRKTPIIAENTRDGWERYLRLRILSTFGDLPIGSITSGKIIDFLLGMQAEGLSQQTVSRYYTLINLIFKMAYMTDVISVNPMDRVEKPKRRKDECQHTKVDACTAEEIAEIIRCAENEELKWQVVLNLLIETGMRIGECLALQWSNVDWANNAITISASLGYTPKKGVYTTTPKNKQDRIVYVSNDLMQLLLQHYHANVFSGPNSPYINHQNDSQSPMHPSSPKHYLAKFAKKYGFPGLHPHKLRHSYASIAITNGADVASVADNLGHRDSSVTLRICC